MSTPRQKQYPFWLGGVAASLAASCTHPLDLTRVRMQTYKSPSGKPVSIFHVFRMTFAESGIRALYQGLTASIFRQMTYSLVRLGSYESIKYHLSADGGRPSSGKLLLAAMAAGGLGGVAGNPADILLVRMTTDSLRLPELRYNYSNVFTGFVSLVRTEGAQGLCRGLGTNTFRAVLMNASQVASYDYFKTTLLHNHIPFINYQFKDGFLLHSFASLCAGTVATTVCAPADVLKSRLMSHSEGLSAVEIFRTSLRDEGPRFLFKGWTPAFIRLGPNTVLLFVFLEQLKKAWDGFAPEKVDIEESTSYSQKQIEEE
ncbi:dicarboxylic acid transporter [Vararia minispora EC-137]|uniref:Dicarboxylic acid transporter n=1 Tax=Vararia minispora EC-137 TaxID=1314806 RepID=A0ACB8Q8Y8_9AGAM|nr:dicarboxylic acid transporter [Vararia minispora EC-137]